MTKKEIIDCAIKMFPWHTKYDVKEIRPNPNPYDDAIYAVEFYDGDICYIY